MIYIYIYITVTTVNKLFSVNTVAAKYSLQFNAVIVTWVVRLHLFVLPIPFQCGTNFRQVCFKIVIFKSFGYYLAFFVFHVEIIIFKSSKLMFAYTSGWIIVILSFHKQSITFYGTFFNIESTKFIQGNINLLMYCVGKTVIYMIYRIIYCSYTFIKRFYFFVGLFYYKP